MLEFHLTPDAESVYAERAAEYGQTIQQYLTVTLPQQLQEGGFFFASDHSYQPTPEEWKMIEEGEADFVAGQSVTLNDAFAAARQAISGSAQ